MSIISSDSIHAAIYGGPLPRGMLEGRLREAGLAFPLFVAVADDRNRRDYHRAWALVPGDGLAYLTASQPVTDYAASWRRATNPQRWRWAMQQSIIALRQSESRDGFRRADPNEEGRMRRLARQRLFAGEGAWREAANRWCSLVLRRTSRKIHDTQLAFAGFLIEASEPLPSIGSAGHRFHRVLQGIFASFTTAALQRLLNEGLGILEEELARAPAKDDRMGQAIRFIKDRAQEPLSLAEVAREARMHPTAFSRKFRATQAQTFTAYLQSIRLERAIKLLKATRRTVLDIALDCGFGSAEQFHRVFKRRMKVTPHAFRRNSILNSSLNANGRILCGIR